MDSSVLQTWWLSLSHFMAQGGVILWWLAAVVAVLWLLVFERVIYLVFYFPQQQQQWITLWAARADHCSWYARAIRDGWLSDAKIAYK